MSFLINALLLIVTWFIYNALTTIFEERILGKPPLVGNTWLEFITGKSASVQDLIKRGYEQYSKNGRAFRYYEGFGTPIYVMPPSHFASVRRSLNSVCYSAPANEASIVAVPFLGEDSGDITHFIRTSITKSINAFIPVLLSETSESMNTYFPSKPDKKHPLVVENGITWTPTNFYTASFPTLGRIFSRICFGKKYSSDPEFTILLTDFAHGVIYQSFLLRYLPRWLCYKIAPLFNTTRRIKRIEAAVRDDVVKLVREYKARSGPASIPASDPQIPKRKAGDDLLILSMVVEYVFAQPSYAHHTEDQLVRSILSRALGITVAFIDTTTLTFNHVMHELLATPYAEYAAPILSQASQVKAANGGQWSVKSLCDLHKLDSFIKETQRLRPLSYILSKRRVMQEQGAVFVSDVSPLDVPTGHGGSRSGPDIFIPKDGHLVMPTWGLHTDEDLYDDANTFKGFRFENDRVASSQPSDRFLSFGHGRHVCPGRHLALAIIKLLTLEFLEAFEFKEGQEGLKRWDFDTSCLPDIEGRILIRKRERTVIGTANGIPLGVET